MLDELTSAVPQDYKDNQRDQVRVNKDNRKKEGIRPEEEGPQAQRQGPEERPGRE